MRVRRPLCQEFLSTTAMRVRTPLSHSLAPWYCSSEMRSKTQCGCLGLRRRSSTAVFRGTGCSSASSAPARASLAHRLLHCTRRSRQCLPQGGTRSPTTRRAPAGSPYWRPTTAFLYPCRLLMHRAAGRLRTFPSATLPPRYRRTCSWPPRASVLQHRRSFMQTRQPCSWRERACSLRTFTLGTISTTA